MSAGPPGSLDLGVEMNSPHEMGKDDEEEDDFRRLVWVEVEWTMGFGNDAEWKSPKLSSSSVSAIAQDLRFSVCASLSLFGVVGAKRCSRGE